MERTDNRPHSDAAWYLRRDAEENAFYEVFFRICRKYRVRWASADPTEKAFVEEITRVTYERERAIREGRSPENVKPAFSA